MRQGRSPCAFTHCVPAFGSKLRNMAHPDGTRPTPAARQDPYTPSAAPPCGQCGTSEKAGPAQGPLYNGRRDTRQDFCLTTATLIGRLYDITITGTAQPGHGVCLMSRDARQMFAGSNPAPRVIMPQRRRPHRQNRAGMRRRNGRDRREHVRPAPRPNPVETRRRSRPPLPTPSSGA